MSSNKLIVLHVDLAEDESIINQYISYHADVWPEVTSDLKDRPIKRMRIYNLQNKLAMLLEVSENFSLDDGIHIQPLTPKVAEWSKLMATFNKKLPSGEHDAWTPMAQVYDTEDYF